jgi:hypothetical protein
VVRISKQINKEINYFLFDLLHGSQLGLASPARQPAPLIRHRQHCEQQQLPDALYSSPNPVVLRQGASAVVPSLLRAIRHAAPVKHEPRRAIAEDDAGEFGSTK